MCKEKSPAAELQLEVVTGGRWLLERSLRNPLPNPAPLQSLLGLVIGKAQIATSCELWFFHTEWPFHAEVGLYCCKTQIATSYSQGTIAGRPCN